MEFKEENFVKVEGVNWTQLKQTGYVERISSMEQRTSGRTTRQADAYIQELFTTGQATVVDHAAPKGIAQRSLINIIVERLKNEHPTTRYELDRDKGIFKLIKNMKRTIQH